MNNDMSELLARLDVWAAERATPFPQCEVMSDAATVIREQAKELEAERDDNEATHQLLDMMSEKWETERKAREYAESCVRDEMACTKKAEERAEAAEAALGAAHAELEKK